MNITLASGLATGIAFGFLLQKGRVLRYDKQLGAMRLKDMTMLKFMLSCIIVGMIGVYYLSDIGLAELSIKPMILGSIVIGGLTFGLGWGLVGFCPGTALGALGEGRLDALWAIVGMLAGSFIYAEADPAMCATVRTWGDFEEITLPQLLGINHWLMVFTFILGVLLLFKWIEKRGL